MFVPVYKEGTVVLVFKRAPFRNSRCVVPSYVQATWYQVYALIGAVRYIVPPFTLKTNAPDCDPKSIRPEPAETY